MLTDEQKARLKELKAKGDLTPEEQTELDGLNKIEPGKTFTQEEVNGMIAKNSKKAVEKLLKDMGIESMESAKDGLSKLKELQNKDKTELQLALDRVAELETENTTLQGEISGGAVKVALLGAGVSGEKLDKYTKLYGITDGDSVEDKIKALMEEFPITSVDNGNPPPNIGGKTTGGSTEKTMAELQAEMDSIADLK
jgi:hypothetical protein